MSDHYYSNNPQSKEVTETITFQLRNHTFTFTSSSGVFSKKTIDFGSRLLIENFSQPNINGKILDLGCGYGPIGLSIAKDFPDRELVMVDINERAVELAKSNAQKNSVRNVTIVQSDGFEQILEEKFAAIVTNPPIRAGKKIIFQFYKESYEKLLENGELWIVIQKKQGAPSTINYLEEMFGQVQVKDKKKGYYIVCAKK